MPRVDVVRQYDIDLAEIEREVEAAVGVGLPRANRALAQALGRDYRGVHADVGVLVDAGLIERDDSGAISVPWSRVSAEMALDVAASAG